MNKEVKNFLDLEILIYYQNLIDNGLKTLEVGQKLPLELNFLFTSSETIYDPKTYELKNFEFYYKLQNNILKVVTDSNKNIVNITCEKEF